MRRQQVGVVIAALVVAVITPVVVTVAASPAQATAYRYWSYWHATGSGWEFSKIGATGARPADGTVEGWRFAVSPGTASAPAPRLSAATAFSSVCGSTAAASGMKRVALVVDFGVANHAPPGTTPPSDALRGTCVSIRAAATGMDVLVAADYAIRTDAGLVCGLAGYPTKGCGEVVADPPAPTKKPPATSGTGGGTSGGGGNGSDAGTADGTRSGRGSGSVTGGSSSQRTTTAAPAPSATGGTVASSAASPSATASGAASEDAIPTAEPLDSTEAVPTLVAGAPAAAADGSSSSPLLAVLAVLVVAGIGLAAFLRNRARRSA